MCIIVMKLITISVTLYNKVHYLTLVNVLIDMNFLLFTLHLFIEHVKKKHNSKN